MYRLVIAKSPRGAEHRRVLARRSAKAGIWRAAVYRELVRRPSGGVADAELRPRIREMAAARPSHPAGKMALHRIKGETGTVRHPADAAAPEDVAESSTLLTPDGGRAYLPHRQLYGGMHQAHEAAVDFLDGGRGYPDGFAALKDGREYDGCIRRRSAAPRPTGWWASTTRLFSVLYRRTLNIGRVVSPSWPAGTAGRGDRRVQAGAILYGQPRLRRVFRRIGKAKRKDEAQAVAAACKGKNGQRSRHTAQREK